MRRSETGVHVAPLSGNTVTLNWACASSYSYLAWKRLPFIGIDLAKHSFQVHGARADGSVAYRRKLSRGKLLGFLGSQPPCTVLGPCVQVW